MQIIRFNMLRYVEIYVNNKIFNVEICIQIYVDIMLLLSYSLQRSHKINRFHASISFLYQYRFLLCNLGRNIAWNLILMSTCKLDICKDFSTVILSNLEVYLLLIIDLYCYLVEKIYMVYIVHFRFTCLYSLYVYMFLCF